MHLQKSIILLAILCLCLSCTKIEPGFSIQKADSKKTTLNDQTGQQESELEKMRREAQILIDSLRTQEKLLAQKETSLDSLQYVLQMREIMLNEKESSFKIIRLTSFLVLFIGLVLTVFGLVLLLKKRKKPEEKQPEKPIANKDTQKATAVSVQENLPVISVSKQQTGDEIPVKTEPEKVIKVQGIVKPAAKKTEPEPPKAAVEKKSTGKTRENPVRKSDAAVNVIKKQSIAEKPVKAEQEKVKKVQSPIKPVAKKASPEQKNPATEKKQIKKTSGAVDKKVKLVKKKTPVKSKKSTQTGNEKT